MKFQSSALECHYTSIWNDSLVAKDRAIRLRIRRSRNFREETNSVHDNVANLISELNLYFQAINNYIWNLARHFGAYEDTDYIFNYLQQAKNAVIQDLECYKKFVLSHHELFAGLEVIIDDYIKDINHCFSCYVDARVSSYEQHLVC